MAESKSVILSRLLERLYASLLHGPSMNCRVHSARQRVDLLALGRLQHVTAPEILNRLVTGRGQIEVLGKVPAFKAPEGGGELSPEQVEAKKAWEEQGKLLGKLRDIAEDARDY